MRSLRFAAALVVATLLHVAGARLFPDFSSAIDLFLLIVVFNALDGNTLAGMLGGLAAGLVTDALTGGPFGIHGLADTIIGYGTAYAVQRLVIQRVTGVFQLFALAAATQQALLMGVSLLLLPSPEAPRILWLMVRIVSTGLLGSVLYLADKRLRSTAEGWQTARSSKIRFDK